MRVLLVSWGFSPWLGGGLVAYAEGVMEAQAARGHQVSAFLAARQLPLWRRPFVRHRRRNGVRVHELVNGPIDSPWGLRTAAFADPDGHVWEVAAPIK